MSPVVPAQCILHAPGVGGIGLGKVRELPLDDLRRHSLQHLGDIGEQPIPGIVLQGGDAACSISAK